MQITNFTVSITPKPMSLAPRDGTKILAYEAGSTNAWRCIYSWGGDFQTDTGYNIWDANRFLCWVPMLPEGPDMRGRDELGNLI